MIREWIGWVVQIAPLPSQGWHVSKSDRAGYTVAMVEKALRIYEAKGREATVEFYKSPESVDGEWYVFIFDENGDMIAHPNPDFLGENLMGPTGVDITGYRHGEAIAGATEEGKWVDYIFLNPVSGNQEYKHTWAVRHDGLIFASGWYQVLPTLGLGVTKAEPAEYTVAFVDRALRYYKAHGRENTVAHYNTPESVDGAWYIYIFDENDLLIAHANPDLLGMDLKEESGPGLHRLSFRHRHAGSDGGGVVDTLCLRQSRHRRGGDQARLGRAPRWTANRLGLV